MIIRIDDPNMLETSLSGEELTLRIGKVEIVIQPHEFLIVEDSNDPDNIFISIAKRASDYYVAFSRERTRELQQWVSKSKGRKK